jgi:hypothetical protein
MHAVVPHLCPPFASLGRVVYQTPVPLCWGVQWHQCRPGPLVTQHYRQRCPLRTQAERWRRVRHWCVRARRSRCDFGHAGRGPRSPAVSGLGGTRALGGGADRGARRAASWHGDRTHAQAGTKWEGRSDVLAGGFRLTDVAERAKHSILKQAGAEERASITVLTLSLPPEHGAGSPGQTCISTTKERCRRTRRRWDCWHGPVTRIMKLHCRSHQVAQQLLRDVVRPRTAVYTEESQPLSACTYSQPW